MRPNASSLITGSHFQSDCGGAALATLSLSLWPARDLPAVLQDVSPTSGKAPAAVRLKFGRVATENIQLAAARPDKLFDRRDGHVPNCEEFGSAFSAKSLQSRDEVPRNASFF